MHQSSLLAWPVRMRSGPSRLRAHQICGLAIGVIALCCLLPWWLPCLGDDLSCAVSSTQDASMVESRQSIVQNGSIAWSTMTGPHHLISSTAAFDCVPQCMLFGFQNTGR